MGVPYRVLEDLAAFNDAVSKRFNFRTIALLCTDNSSRSTVGFLQEHFDIVDRLTGSEILAVTLEEPRGGYWRYLHAREGSTDPNSVHTLLDHINQHVTTKGELSRESLSYRQPARPPERGELREVLIRLDLPVIEAPFLLLFDVPTSKRSIWYAHAYAVVALNDRAFADPSQGEAVIRTIFNCIYSTHESVDKGRVKDLREQSEIFSHTVEAQLPTPAAEVRTAVPPPITFSHFVAVYNTRTSADVKLVISIHGITTRGAWQKDMTPWMGLQGWIHMPIDYGYFPKSLVDVATFLMGRTREHLLQKFREKYDEIVHDQSYTSYKNHVVVIAHSFGTKIAADALLRYGHLLQFERFIFCGSIVNADYNWGACLSAGCIRGLLNEYGTLDFWTRTYARIRREQMAGATGFNGPPPVVINRPRQVTHSDWFNRLQFDTVWVPYLRTGSPPP